MYQLTLVRVAILQGLASVRETLGMAELSSLCERIAGRDETIENLHGYAFIAGRNAGISLGRKRRREAQRAVEAEAAEQAQWARTNLVTACQVELDTLCDAVSAPSEAWLRWSEMMDTVRFSLAGVPVRDICEALDVSADVVYQWRRRALLALDPHMSDTLRAWLQEHGREFGLGYKG